MRRWVLTASAAMALAACGGGDPVDPFDPSRMIAFGDELSLLQSDGRKYTVNALTTATPPAIDCVANPLWTQVVARGFGMRFSQCVDGTLPPDAEQRGAVGLTVAQLVPLVDTFMTTGSPKDADLITVLVGMHDVLEVYAGRATSTPAAMAAELGRRGSQLAAQVNRMANAGPAVVVMFVPDLGLTPFARTEGQQALLSDLTTAFNRGLRIDMVQDGRLVGVVFADAELDNAIDNPGSYGLSNVRDIACATPVPDCTTATLVAGASATSWLFAGDKYFGPTFNRRLGDLALSRAVNNPF